MMADHQHEDEEVKHDDECADEIRYSGACRHGHAFRGGCDRPGCQFKDDQ